MALICTTITTWVTQKVFDPIDTWVSQQQNECKNYPWPLNWFCEFVTVFVKIILWVARNILVAIFTVTCVLVTWLIGAILYPFAWAIDSICQTCNAHQWVEVWWLTPTNITFVKRENSVNTLGSFDYIFICNCKTGKKEIIITATDDVEAAKLATAECKAVC